MSNMTYHITAAYQKMEIGINLRFDGCFQGPHYEAFVDGKVFLEPTRLPNPWDEDVLLESVIELIEACGSSTPSESLSR